MSSRSQDVPMGALAIGAIAAGALTTRRFSTFSSSGVDNINGEDNLSDIKRKNVGILAMEVYTPSTYISQAGLEEHNGVSKGKYEIGLGQEGMGICGDSEDVNSICLTVVHSLMEKYGISPMEVGRLEVGTETLVDKSKSTKTILMDLFKPNHDIEGATVVNACYGGTAALFNAFAWVESDGWDGRYAIVVSGDIAAYARGPARPTCGVGAVATLVGRDAPLVFDPRTKATHAENVWDFFKPDHTVEYPTVDGKLSGVCYYRALEGCYSRYKQKMEKISKNSKQFDAVTPDYFVFHAPYNKLVQKSYARLFLADARENFSSSGNDEHGEEKKAPTDNPLSQWINIPIEETYADRALDGTLKKIAAQAYKEKLTDSNYASKKIGNTYTASVFMGIASLVDRVGSRGDLTPGKKITVFSYGSGAIASMYCLSVRETASNRFTISTIAKNLSLSDRLERRELVHPSELDYALETRARMHRNGAPYSPVYPTVGRLFPGTYYLNGVDSNWCRTYSRVPLDADMLKDEERLAPPIVLRLAQKDLVTIPVTGKLSVSAHEREAKKRLACVVTGISAGLPGNDGPTFHPDNLTKLVEGRQCIKRVSGSVTQALLDKNVVQRKRKTDGTFERTYLNTETQVISLAAQVGSLSLSSMYGVPRGLEETMDIAARLAVAAGMEALKNAGLVSGKSNESAEWRLAEKYENSTGVVYASSFPAMDAAVGEVMKFLQSKTVGAATTTRLLTALRSRFIRASPDRELSDDDEAAFARMELRIKETQGSEDAPYEFDRKFLFRVLVLGNSQLAQLTGCKGPNTQTNAACAGTTQAIAMAQDMLISGRAERVVVVAGDNASGDTLLPWLGSGFAALGAACTVEVVEDAALPFDKRRSGMLIGAGGIGMILETEDSMVARRMENPSLKVKARLLATQYSNSAFHGAALDRNHIGAELTRFLDEVELIHGIRKEEVATHGVYFSHETGTHASSSSSCAGNEIAALRMAFGDHLLSKLRILNTKGFTGHPMGVSFEDVTAVEVLMRQVVPPIVNYKEKDDYLGDINISRDGGPYAFRYALRFAAGFGSQVAFALYATASEN